MTMDNQCFDNDFAAQLRAAYEARDLELRSRFQRSLPLQDAMFDRWERGRSLGFGEGTSIYNSAIVMGEVSVGRETWIGPYVLLDGSGGQVRVGSTCSLAVGVHIYTHDTIGWALSGGRLAPRRAPVSIGDCTYVGPQSIVAAGVRVGSRCLIAANSLVHRNVPDSTIVGGNPARRLGVVEMRDGEPVLLFDSGGETRLTEGDDERV